MSQLDTVLALQRALGDLHRAERLLGGVPEWMADLHAEHSARKSQIEALEEAVEEATRERRKNDTEIEDAQDQLKHYQEQISLVRTQREYAALLQEIDTVKSRVKELEEGMLAVMEQLEEARRELESQRSDFQELDARYQQELAKWEKEKPSVAQQAETLRATVNELRGELPVRLLSLFNRLAGRYDGEAVAPVRMVQAASGDSLWHCAACHYRVRLHVVSQIRGRQQLVQCDGCKRILYVEDEEGD